ncbi:MAG TPA: YIP1 family protein [Alphaproteobacteria bacterium]|nr:YIP1 family protein [Alphaproteobacteria bacterium]
MVDIAAAMGRVRGMVLQPGETMAQHTRPVPPWQVVAREHTLPLLIGSSILSTLLLWLLMPMMMAMPGMGAPGPGMALLRLVLNVAVNFGLVALMSGVVMIFAGMLGGRASFDASYALVALALTPLFVGEAFVPIPMIGILAFIGGLIYALVILYRNTPSVLGVPSENRGKHFVLTIVSMFLLSMAVAFAFASLIFTALDGSSAGMGELSGGP